MTSREAGGKRGSIENDQTRREMYFVYVLKSLKDGSTYIGMTTNLERRVVEHNEGRTKSIKHKVPYTLHYYEAYLDKTTARKREIKLKKSGYEKEKLFERLFRAENTENTADE